MVIWWGKDLVLLYNDAWRPVLGVTKHPQALGRPGREIWPEIWDIIGAQLEGVLATGQATWSDDLLLLVERHGYTEEAYFTYSYSPIPEETGEIGGAFTAVTETTQRVLGERRMQTLRDLAAQAGQAQTAEQACQAAIQTLAENPADIPFTLLYLLAAEGDQVLLCGGTPLEADAQTAYVSAASPRWLDLTQAEREATHWPLTSVVRTGCAALVEDLPQRFGQMPSGPWAIPPQQALVLPIRAVGQERLAGLLVVGVNPCRVLDSDYRNFFEMTAGHIATAIANARAYEEARKRAEALAELDRAKTDFFSNVSHEFRTPLTLMLGPLEAVLAKPSRALLTEEREALEMVHRNGLRLLKLVNTLLDFSRIEAGRVQASYRPTNLSSFTAELASVFRSAVEQAGMKLLVDCPPLPEPIYVDREMWEKIILNLLSNAFKFTFEGEIVVTLRWVDDDFGWGSVGAAAEMAESGQPTSRLSSNIQHSKFIKLEVRDTGTGIPAEELPHLFERFHRVNGAAGRTHEGSGIGLSLVQELVRLHGGTIQVKSRVGQGTSFTIKLPAGFAHLPAEACVLAGGPLVSPSVTSELRTRDAKRTDRG
jgi:signal transduction histidine kinase